jgi:hypothetical protein
MKYRVAQSFSTENETVQDESLTQSFTNKKDALKYFDEIKNNTQQGGTIVTDFWIRHDVIESFYSNFDYSPLYGNFAKPMLGVVLNETELENDYPVYWDYLYVCDGKVVKSDVQGTIADLKRDLRSHYKLEAKVITTCDIEGRRKLAGLS